MAFETTIVFPRGMGSDAGEDTRLLANFIICADSTEITVDWSHFVSISSPISSFLFFLVKIHVPNHQTTIGMLILGGISWFVVLIFLFMKSLFLLPCFSYSISEDGCGIDLWSSLKALSLIDLSSLSCFLILSLRPYDGPVFGALKNASIL